MGVNTNTGETGMERGRYEEVWVYVAGRALVGE